MAISINNESWKINGHTLEYDDTLHAYIVDGILTPSVTQILSRKYNDYEYINKSVLDEASRKGTAMHKAIEIFETTGKMDDSPELRNYIFLKSHYKWQNIENEVPIIYEEDGRVLFAGRLDQVITINSQSGINDFKRVATPNKEKIALQLNMYKMGYEQSYKKKIDFLRYTQLKDNTRKFAPLPIVEKKYILAIIKGE